MEIVESHALSRLKALFQWWILLILVGAVSLTGCETAQPRVARQPPKAPEDVRTRLSLAAAPSAGYLFGVGYDPLPASSLVDYELTPDAHTGRRLALYALTKATSTARKLENRSFQELIDVYQDRLDLLGRRYMSFENFMGSLGMNQGTVRQGIGITAAAATATVGTLHMLMPVAISPEIMGTGMRAGYDISRLDDPRMMFAYADRLSVTVSKNGFGGTLSGERLSYTADLNIRRLEASANVTLDRNLTLGTVYAVNDESVQGFVRLSF